MPLGDEFDGAVGHFDGGVVVDRVRRTRQAGGLSFCFGHGVLRQIGVIHVREDREVDDSERAVVTAGRRPPDEVLPDPRGQHHAPGAEPYVDRSLSDGSRSASPDCFIQWPRYRASPPFTSRTSVSWTRWNPAFCVEAGQRGELQHSQGFHPTRTSVGRTDR